MKFLLTFCAKDSFVYQAITIIDRGLRSQEIG